MTSGAAPRAFPGSMRGARSVTVPYFQEPRDQGEIVRQYTKMDHRLEHTDVPGLMVSRLLQLAMSEPRGPVQLTVPQECAMRELPGTARFPTRDQLGLARPLWPDPDDARTVARWLIEAEHPLLFVGSAGRDPAAVGELVRLVELLALPVAEGPSADRLSFPMTHWAYGTAHAAMQADVVVVMEEMAHFLPGGDGPSGEAKIAWFSADPVYSRYKTREFRADLWIASAIGPSARAIADSASELLTARAA
jgi:acetolactate synthase-1/2/3 large subunit